MDYKIGNSKKIKEAGTTAEITCPNCDKKVSMSVYSNLNTDIVAKFPIIKNNTVFFAVCPECSSVFGIDEARGKELKKGEKLSIGNFDLFELKKYKE